MSTPSLISIHRDGQDFGPYAEDEIKQHIASGSLVPSDLAWHEGLENWQPLGSLPELEACFSQSAAAAPPITPVHTRLQFPTSEALRTQPDPEGQSQGSGAKNKFQRGWIIFGLLMFGGLFVPQLSCLCFMGGLVAFFALAVMGDPGSGSVLLMSVILGLVMLGGRHFLPSLAHPFLMGAALAFLGFWVTAIGMSRGGGHSSSDGGGGGGCGGGGCGGGD